MRKGVLNGWSWGSCRKDLFITATLESSRFHGVNSTFSRTRGGKSPCLLPACCVSTLLLHPPVRDVPAMTSSCHAGAKLGSPWRRPFVH